MSQNTRSKRALLLVGVAVFGALGVSCAPGQVSAENETKPAVRERKDRAITKLISAGRDPKSALRYKVAKGDRQYVALTADVSLWIVTAFLGGRPLPSPRWLLGHGQEWLVTATDVMASGDVAFEVSIARSEMAPREDSVSREASGDLADWIQSRAGRSASFVMSSRGVPKSYSNDLNDGLDPIQRDRPVNPIPQQLREGMENYLPFVAIPFPEAPIGVGAKWSVSREVESQGVHMAYAAVYELTRFENGTGTVTTSVERTTQPYHVLKKIGRDGMRLNSMTMTTTGTHDFSLEKILPETESLQSTTETYMVIEFPTSNMVVSLLVEVAQESRSEFGTPDIDGYVPNPSW